MTILFRGQAIAADSREGPFEIVFLLDASEDVYAQGTLFDDQKQAIIDALCPPTAYVPADGSVKVAVVQFGTPLVREIVLTTVTPTTRDQICEQIGDILPNRNNRDFLGALDEAAAIFDASDEDSAVSASGRLVMIHAIDFVQPEAPIQVTRQPRAMDQAGRGGSWPVVR